MAGERIILGAAALPEPDRDWLAAVERLPIESIWQGGHVLPRQPTGEAITRLALMTAWTERVRVGTAILLLPLYHPVVVAKQVADLDAWSGGRVSVGVGVGGEFPHEFEAVGVPLRERGARTDEAMQVLRSLWAGGPVTHHGRFFDLDDVDPAAGGAPRRRAVARAARRAAAARVGPQGAGDAAGRPARRRLDAVPLLAGRLRPLGGRRSGPRPRPPAATSAASSGCSTLYCSIRRDGDRARDDVARFLGGAYGDKPRALLDRIAPAGTPDEVAARFQEYVDAGVRHIVISPAAPADTLEVVTLAAEEVLPRLTLPVSAEVAP